MGMKGTVQPLPDDFSGFFSGFFSIHFGTFPDPMGRQTRFR